MSDTPTTADLADKHVGKLAVWPDSRRCPDPQCPRGRGRGKVTVSSYPSGRQKVWCECGRNVVMLAVGVDAKRFAQGYKAHEA